MIKTDKKNNKIVMVILIAVTLMGFLCFTHGDVYITAQHGLNFWDCLFSGKIRNFYSYNENAFLKAGLYSGEYNAAYDFLIYFIFALWNFPLWVIKKIFKIPNVLDSYFSMLWAKSIVILFLGLVVFMIYKIVCLIKAEKADFFQICFFCLSSASVFLYCISMGQYDVVVLFFMLLGLYYAIKDDLIKFTLFFSIAIPIKLFAVLGFVAILLYKEKRILKVILHCIFVVIPYILFKILFPMPYEGNTSYFMGMVFQNKIQISYGDIPIFVLAIVIFYLVCFLTKPKNINMELPYICMIPYVIFVLTCPLLPYWYLYMFPFMIIVMACNEEMYTNNMLLELLISLFAIIAQVFRFFWLYSSSISENFLISKILSGRTSKGKIPHDLFYDLCGEENYNKYISLITPVAIGICIACIIVFLIMNCPFYKVRTNEKRDKEIIIYSILRICSIVGLVLFFLIEYE